VFGPGRPWIWRRQGAFGMFTQTVRAYFSILLKCLARNYGDTPVVFAISAYTLNKGIVLV